jgi:hypothetical protein
MSDIKVHAEGGVMTITLNRLERKNSITAAMYGMLADAIHAAQEDANVRVAVLQGHETVFSAGNDINDFLNNPPAGQDSPVFRFLRGIASFPKPLLAAVCGPAVGIGTTMLFHCDLVYAGDNAAFSMPFVNLGLCPGQQLRAGAGEEAGGQAAQQPGGNQAPDEAGPAAKGAAADAGRGRQFWPHAAGAGRKGSVRGVHGKAAAGFFEGLKRMKASALDSLLRALLSAMNPLRFGYKGLLRNWGNGSLVRARTGQPALANVPRAGLASGCDPLLLLYFAKAGCPVPALRRGRSCCGWIEAARWGRWREPTLRWAVRTGGDRCR